MPLIAAAFYHFFDFPHYANAREALLTRMQQLDIKGSVLLAAEGINGTVTGTPEAINQFLLYIKKEVVKADFAHKESPAGTAHPFGKAKVRLKKETISLGEPTDVNNPGEYVTPEDWNALISAPGTVIIDTRNDYEVHLGTFKGATNPNIQNFKQLPAVTRAMALDKDTPIATFCTGGIRCEKYTAWLKAEGFTRVYHLKGGILKYLEDMPEEKSLWDGECYVFDERVAVGHGLKPSASASACPSCGHALTPADRTHAHFIEGAQCAFCAPENFTA